MSKARRGLVAVANLDFVKSKSDTEIEGLVREHFQMNPIECDCCGNLEYGWECKTCGKRQCSDCILDHVEYILCHGHRHVDWIINSIERILKHYFRQTFHRMWGFFWACYWRKWKQNMEVDCNARFPEPPAWELLSQLGQKLDGCHTCD